LTSEKNTGARWEIAIDGTPRSYRDDKRLAIEGAEYLKSRNPQAEVAVARLRGQSSRRSSSSRRHRSRSDDRHCFGK